MASLTLQSHSRLGTKTPFPIPDKLFSIQEHFHYRSPHTVTKLSTVPISIIEPWVKSPGLDFVSYNLL